MRNTHRRVLRCLRWLVDGIVAAVFLIAASAGVWVGVLHRYTVPLTYGEYGTYAEVTIPEILTLDTKVESFEAVITPMAWYPILPIHSALQVRVQYIDEQDVDRVWEATYITTCDPEGDCMPVTGLNGIGLAGRARNGGTEILKWIPLDAHIWLPRKPPTPLVPLPEPCEPEPEPLPRPLQNA